MKSVLRVAAILAACVANSVSAATLSATTSNANLGDFTITFNDVNHNGQFDIAELIDFSGFYVPILSTQLVAILNAPTIAGISVPGVVPGANTIGDGWWSFEAFGAVDLDWDVAILTDQWSYQITPSAVPVPAALPMLLAGLGGLAAVGRRARSKRA